MCQPQRMNANTPTDVKCSFAGLAWRADAHQDGSGAAFSEHRPGLRQVIDQAPARRSPGADPMRRLPIRSGHVIARIRQATRGRVGRPNTHPLSTQALLRGLRGRCRLFAHHARRHVDFGPLTSPGDRVAPLATQPLTRDKAWTAIPPGGPRVCVDGQSAVTLASPLRGG